MNRKYQRMKDQREAKAYKKSYSDKGKRLVKHYNRKTKKMEIVAIDVPKPYRKEDKT